MKTTETTQVRSTTQSHNVTTTVSDRISTATLGVAGTVGILVGLWSFAALAAGLIASGGPLGLVKAYFQAVTGL